MSSGNAARKVWRSRPWLPEKWDFEADVVIVGYGGAGVSAAIAAHDAGVSMLVLEKAPVGGGNTGCCGGGSRIPSDVPNAIKFYRALCHGTNDEELIRALAEAMVELPRWLESLGAELEWLKQGLNFPTLPGAESFSRIVSIARTPQQVAEQKAAGGTVYPTRGDQLFGFLDKQAKKRAIRVMFNTPGKVLIQDPVTKEILGVRAESAGELISVKARRGVVLSCGGFQNNKDLLMNYLPYLTQLPVCSYGTPYNTGDGIEMAMEAGAKLWHMSGCELGMFALRIPSEKYGVGIRLERQLPKGSAALYVNKSGRRFMNEAQVLSHRKDPFTVQYFDHDRAEFPNIPFYMIFDESYRVKRPIVGMNMGWWCVQNVYKWSRDNSAEVAQGWIVKGDTIRELAAKIGLDPDAMEETVRKYSVQCTTGKDPEFARAKDWLVPLQSPPYYATELCEPIINTQGGPKHNALAQVLNRHDKPIPRLYAAGELGSFFFPLYESGSNVPEALSFGRIAGQQASALAPWNEEDDDGPSTSPDGGSRQGKQEDEAVRSKPRGISRQCELTNAASGGELDPKR